MYRVQKTVFLKSFLLISIALCSSFAMAAETVVNENGRLRVKDITYWRGKQVLVDNWQKTNELNKNSFIGSANISTKIQTNSGVQSATKVKGTIVTTVPKSGVIKGVLQNAIKGAKAIGGRTVYGAAMGLLLSTLNSDKQGKPIDKADQYRFDKDTDQFVRDVESGHYACMDRFGLYGNIDAPTNADDCFARDTSKVMYIGYVHGSVDEPIDEDGYSPSDIENARIRSNAAEMLCLGQESTSYYIEGSTFVGYEYDRGRCFLLTKSKHSDVISKRNIARFRFGSGGTKPQPWDGNVDIDRNWERWIEVAEDDNGNIPESSSVVVVDNGQVAQTPAFTDPKDGKPKQIRWDFETIPGPENGGLGTTKVREREILRPDLTPNSPEAPAPSGGMQIPPEPKPQNPPSTSTPPNTGSPTGTGGTVEIPPSPNTSDTAPKEGGSGGDPSKNKDEDTGKDKEQEQPDLCEKHPDILACDKQPEKSELDELPEIPTEIVNLKFNPDSVFPNAGQCPIPVSFQAMGQTYQISTQPICDVAVKMRPFIIALAYLAAAFFLIRVIKSETA